MFLQRIRIFIWQFIPGGSWLSQVVVSLETKLDIIVSLKLETYSLTSKSGRMNASETSQLLFLYDQKFMEKFDTAIL